MAPNRTPDQPLDPGTLYRPRTAGAFLGRGETFTRQLIKRGLLAAVLEGGVIRVPGWAIRDYLDSLPQVASQQPSHLKPCKASTRRGKERAGQRAVIVEERCQCSDFAARNSTIPVCGRTGCGHPANFHGTGHHCAATGCACSKWLEPDGPNPCTFCGHDAIRHGVSSRPKPPPPSKTT